MGNWKSVRIHKNMVVYRNKKSVLIKMPYKSEYSGYFFWHPSKLYREPDIYSTTISYTDDFIFHLKKYGNENDVIEEKNISSHELKDAFRMISEYEPTEEDELPLIHTPDILEPEHAEALKELIDDD